MQVDLQERDQDRGREIKIEAEREREREGDEDQVAFLPVPHMPLNPHNVARNMDMRSTPADV